MKMTMKRGRPATSAVFPRRHCRKARNDRIRFSTNLRQPLGSSTVQPHNRLFIVAGGRWLLGRVSSDQHHMSADEDEIGAEVEHLFVASVPTLTA